MNSRSHSLRFSAAWAFLLGSLVLVSCLTQPLAAPEDSGSVLTQVMEDAVNRAAATAEFLRANAQATLDSANATLSAAQIQQKDSADVIAAQVADAALIAQVNAQNTYQTQRAYQETQVQDQQNKSEMAATTQTAAANLMATQTQSALATSQWYTDQSRQRLEQSQSLVSIILLWGFPLFLILLVGMFIWGLWRMLKIQQANLVIFDNSVEKSPKPVAEAADFQPDDSPHYQEIYQIDSRYQLTKPVDHVRLWLDDVKRKLLIDSKKDQDDHTDN